MEDEDEEEFISKSKSRKSTSVGWGDKEGPARL